MVSLVVRGVQGSMDRVTVMHQEGWKLLPFGASARPQGWRNLELPVLGWKVCDTHLWGDLGKKLVGVGPRCCELEVEA